MRYWALNADATFVKKLLQVDFGTQRRESRHEEQIFFVSVTFCGQAGVMYILKRLPVGRIRDCVRVLIRTFPPLSAMSRGKHSP